MLLQIIKYAVRVKKKQALHRGDNAGPDALPSQTLTNILLQPTAANASVSYSAAILLSFFSVELCRDIRRNSLWG